MNCLVYGNSPNDLIPRNTCPIPVALALIAALKTFQKALFVLCITSTSDRIASLLPLANFFLFIPFERERFARVL